MHILNTSYVMYHLQSHSQYIGINDGTKIHRNGISAFKFEIVTMRHCQFNIHMYRTRITTLYSFITKI